MPRDSRQKVIMPIGVGQAQNVNNHVCGSVCWFILALDSRLSRESRSRIKRSKMQMQVKIALL